MLPRLSHLIDRNRLAATVLRAGPYTDPVGGWSMDVTTDTIDQLVGSFKAMRDNGVTVPLTLGFSTKVDAVRGKAIDAYREGDELVLVFTLCDDAIGPATDEGLAVGPEIHRNMVDGLGRAYGPAIVSAAFAPAPSQAQRIAASLRATGAPAQMVDRSITRLGLTTPADEPPAAQDAPDATPADLPTASLVMSLAAREPATATAPVHHLSVDRLAAMARQQFAGGTIDGTAEAMVDDAIARAMVGG